MHDVINDDRDLIALLRKGTTTPLHIPVLINNEATNPAETIITRTI